MIDVLAFLQSIHSAQSRKCEISLVADVGNYRSGGGVICDCMDVAVAVYDGCCNALEMNGNVSVSVSAFVPPGPFSVAVIMGWIVVSEVA